MSARVTHRLGSRFQASGDRAARLALYGPPVAVMAVALVVRLVGLNHPLLPDEGYTWLVGSAPSPGGFLRRLAVYENTPPLYYLLLTPLSLHAEWLIRLPSLISGVALVGIIYAVVRPALGWGTATLAALGLAIAPYAVAESNFGRAYLLADLWLLACLWGAVRLAERRSERWWWLYWVGAVGAIYTEYDAALTLVPLYLGLVVLRAGPERRRTALLGALPALAFLLWIPQLIRSVNDLDVTKTGIGYLTVTPGYIRDQLVSLFYGETGQNLGSGMRTLALVILVAALGWGTLAIRRRGAQARPLLVLTGFAGLGTFLLHALAPAAGVGIFNVGYITFVLPLGMIVLAGAVSSLPGRAVLPAACCALLALGVGLAVKRSHKAPDIDTAAIASRLQAAHARTILTNSAVVAYYFRAQHVILDRPFNLGPGLVGRCGCARPIAIVDDANVGSGARAAPGPAYRVGHYVVRLLAQGQPR